MKPKVIRISTVPLSLHLLLQGQLKMLAETYEVLAVSSSGEELHKVAEREGVRTCAIPMERHIAPLKDLIALIRLIILFRKEKPQIVHSLTPKAGLLAMMAARICRVPIRIHTFTGVINCYRQTHLCLCDLPQSGRERCEERSGTFPYHQPGIASYRKR